MKQYLVSSATSKSSFYEKAHAYCLLYSAQLALSKGNFEVAVECLSQTFVANPKLCNNENFVVFCLSVLKKLIKVAPKALDAILKCTEIIAKELNPKQEKHVAILLYMADTMMTLGVKAYLAANKIYEALMNAVSMICNNMNRE